MINATRSSAWAELISVCNHSTAQRDEAVTLHFNWPAPCQSATWPPALSRARRGLAQNSESSSHRDISSKRKKKKIKKKKKKKKFFGCYFRHVDFLLCLFLDSEDGGNIFLRNSPLREPQHIKNFSFPGKRYFIITNILTFCYALMNLLGTKHSNNVQGD
jgi:hypothetical protein